MTSASLLETSAESNTLLQSPPAVDEMGGRLDELEKSISDLIQQAGVDDDDSKDAPPAIAST